MRDRVRIYVVSAVILAFFGGYPFDKRVLWTILTTTQGVHAGQRWISGLDGAS